MGCNAYNYPPDCDCGWGGKFCGSISLASPPVPEQYIPYFRARAMQAIPLRTRIVRSVGKRCFFISPQTVAEFSLTH